MDTLECKYIDELEELRGCERSWEELRRRCGGSVFTSHYISMAWLKVYRSAASPCIVAVEDRGEVVGIAPLIHKRMSFAGFPVRALSLVGDADTKLTLDPLRFLVPPDRPDVMDRMVRGIGRLGWNILNVNYLEDADETRLLIDRVQRSWETCTPTAMTTTACRLPETGELMDHYGSHTRHKLGQAIRKAEREVGLEFRAVPPERAGEAVTTYVRQHVERWGAKGGSIFKDPENVDFLRVLMRESMARGDAAAYELLMNGEVAAQEFSFKDGEICRGFRLGMNNAYSKYAPGMIMAYLVMTECRDRGFREFSRGSGGESYKLRTMGEERTLMGMQARRGVVSWLTQIAAAAPARPANPSPGMKGGLLERGPDGLSGNPLPGPVPRPAPSLGGAEGASNNIRGPVA